MKSPSRIKIRIPTWTSLSCTYRTMRVDFPRAIRLFFQYTPGWTTANLVLILILGLLPLVSLFIMKGIVDTVTAGITAVDKAPIVHNLILLLIAAVAVALITAGGRALSAYVTNVQSMVMGDEISDIIHEKSVALELAYYENPKYYNTLHLAQSDGPSRPGQVVGNLVQLAQTCISLLAVGTFLLLISPLTGIVLIGATVPAALIRLYFSQKNYDLHIQQTEMERKSLYYNSILTSSYHAKEVRLFALGTLIRTRYRGLRSAMRHAQLTLTRSRAMWDVFAQGFVTVAIFGSYAVIAFMTIEGVLTLGDMVVYFAGFQMCIGYVQSLFGGLNALYEDHLFLRNFFLFLDLKPTIATPANPHPVPIPIEQGIQVQGVSFTYPGSSHQVLSNVSFTIKRGEVIALVGLNGAGKSTLVKLLCRLYIPDSGTISVDKIDLSEVDPEEWRRRVAVIFQDYVHYQLTARENIWIADVGIPLESPRVEFAARDSDAEGVIKRLPEGYDTVLGSSFSSGRELSVGEWQKIALARAFLRDADFVILDEPASSLDALAEAEVFKNFREIIHNRSAVLISHRFSTILMADHIYVLDSGSIVEHGTHSELMVNNGLYAEMFRAQADLFQEEKKLQSDADRTNI